jgi:hypothetical protein
MHVVVRAGFKYHMALGLLAKIKGCSSQKKIPPWRSGPECAAIVETGAGLGFSGRMPPNCKTSYFDYNNENVYCITSNLQEIKGLACLYYLKISRYKNILTKKKKKKPMN